MNKNSDKLRAGIYGMAAIYMLYTALQLYKEGGNGAAIIFFVAAAVGLIIFSAVIALRVTKAEKKNIEIKSEEAKSVEIEIEESEKIV